MKTTRPLSLPRAALLALALLTLLLAGPAALAQSSLPAPDDGPPHGRWWKNPRVVERLALTDDQTEAIDEIAFETGQRMIDIRAAREKAHLKLKRLLDSESPDRAAVDRALEDLENVQCEASRLEVRSRTRIALVLDREQRETLMDRFEQFERRRDRAPMMDRRRMRRDAPRGDGR